MENDSYFIDDDPDPSDANEWAILSNGVSMNFNDYRELSGASVLKGYWRIRVRSNCGHVDPNV